MAGATGRRTRGRMSRIQRLPKSIREALDELLRDGVPQSRILEQLKPLLAELGEPPLSRSGLNRYTTRMEQFGQRIKETREIAAAWTARLGEDKEGSVSQHAIEMLRTFIFEIMWRYSETPEDGEAPLDAGTINTLALAISRLEKASHLSIRAIREKIEAAAEQAAETAREAAQEAGYALSPETLRAIRQQVYGIIDEKAA